EKNYNRKNLNVYKGNWKRKVRTVAKKMGYKLLEANTDCLDTLNYGRRKKTSVSSSVNKSTNSNHKLADSEKKLVVDLYNSIPTSGEWTLSTGGVVDDQIKQLAKKCISSFYI
ncbi:hypothetical protein BDF14DRAFT_1723058, partial [Spinellus fusiger]